MWFQKDVTTARTARYPLTVLRKMLPGRLVSLVGGLGCLRGLLISAFVISFLGDILKNSCLHAALTPHHS